MSILSNLATCRDDIEDYMHDVDGIYQHVHSCWEITRNANLISGGLSDDIDALSSFLDTLDDLSRDLRNAFRECCNAVEYAKNIM